MGPLSPDLLFQLVLVPMRYNVATGHFVNNKALCAAAP